MFQGSALGPLLYCVFANDLSLFAGDAVVVQYADDTQILVSGPKNDFQNTIYRMEQVLASLDIWFRANGLKVNAGKTQLMVVGSQPNIRTVPNFTVKLRDHHITPCLEAKNIGLVFDRTLSWNSHVSLVTKRCFGILAGLSHLSHSLPPSVITLLVNSLVLSQVRYCLSVFGNGTQNNLSRLQKIINYSAKVIFRRKKYDHVSDIIETLGWLSAGDLVRHQTICLTHKVICTGEPVALASGLRTVNQVHLRHTRRDGDLFVPRSRTEMGKRRFLSRGPSLYNEVPDDLKRLPIRPFRRALKRHMLPAPFGT